MGFNFIDWDVGLKLIGKLADFFLMLSVEGKLINYFLNCSWFNKPPLVHWKGYVLKKFEMKISKQMKLSEYLNYNYEHFMENDS